MELVSLPNAMRTVLADSKLRNVQGKSNRVKPFVSLECLDEHLKILELKGYRGLVSECIVSLWCQIWRLWVPIPRGGWPDVWILSTKRCSRMAAQAVLASHRGGPCRRLSLTWRDSFYVSEVLQLPGLDGLHEFELCLCYFPSRPPTILFKVPRYSPALRVLTLCCRRSSGRLELPAAEAAAELGFPHLEQLTLKGVIIRESTLHGILSRCPSLQSLVLQCNAGYSHLRISSQTLRSLGVSVIDGHKFKGEVVIEDAPLLERLFQDGPAYRDKIRVIKAPKLKMLGYLRDSYSELLVSTNRELEKRELVIMPHAMATVKILALDVAPHNPDAVIDLLTWFPCVEKLYMVLGHSKVRNVHWKSNDVSLECLDEQLKILEFKGYRGIMSEVMLVRFFLSNARVLESLNPRKICYKKWISTQRHKLRPLGPNAPCGVQFFFEPEQEHRPRLSSCVPIKHIHNLAMDDPFDTSSCTCPRDDDD
ncbi:hypothetical protein HU200_051170 [Digitaria exilis]|uniref:FBD domain-containing protein n=1 Tax=Digitaria exilis TaxID=1010633 RepID=A0A835E740_9POAL|nr:hypothetical protein HU200_051170 [Digitaria exilis]